MRPSTLYYKLVRLIYAWVCRFLGGCRMLTMRKIREKAYRSGHRPGPHSILYSPSMHLIFTYNDTTEAFKKGYEKAQEELKKIAQ